MTHSLLHSGDLDRRVTIERYTSTKDAHGEDVFTWASVAVRWAAVTPAPGMERFQNAETAAEAPIRFVLRWEAGLVTVKDRILHEDGRHYYVASVTEVGRREGIEVLASARAE